jgi:hypothetical protein
MIRPATLFVGFFFFLTLGSSITRAQDDAVYVDEPKTKSREPFKPPPI